MNGFARILIFTSTISLLSGCGPDETPPPLPEIEFKLVITDSIGVEIGEPEYMLSWPVDPTHTPDGNIIFLDRMKHAAFIFTPEGEYLRTVGREGEGPGEFHLPTGLEFFSDGRLMIRDQDKIALFDSNFDFVDQMTWRFTAPYVLVALDSGGFVGRKWSPRVDEGLFITSTLARWDGEEDPSVEYFCLESQWDIDDNVIDHRKSRGDSYFSCATRNGLVFYSRSSINEFVIHGCEPDGTEFLLIEDESIHRVRKSEEELQAEMDALYSLITFMPGNSGRSPETILDPYKKIIEGMFMINEQLWIRLGYYPGIVFRVYDMNGEILFHAEVEYSGNPVELNSWEVVGDQQGFLAYNTNYELFQRVYMLDLVEND